jgi:hypothetical protein
MRPYHQKTAEDEIQAEHASPQASEVEPHASSSVWIKDTDLLFRDLLRGALAHLLSVFQYRVLRGAPPTFSLGDQIVYAEFNRQHAEPRPEPGPDASEIEKWLAEDLNPFEGIKCYRA